MIPYSLVIAADGTCPVCRTIRIDPDGYEGCKCDADQPGDDAEMMRACLHADRARLNVLVTRALEAGLMATRAAQAAGTNVIPLTRPGASRRRATSQTPAKRRERANVRAACPATPKEDARGQ